MAFCTAEAFPEEYRGDAFIAMYGSWNRGMVSASRTTTDPERSAHADPRHARCL
jgi:glucose/arabinose dehydrogenase